VDIQLVIVNLSRNNALNGVIQLLPSEDGDYRALAVLGFLNWGAKP